MRIPFSPVLILLSFALYGVQHVMMFGIVLMMMGAPAWSIFLINAAFIGICIETLWRRLRIAWLIAPALWFGGNALLAAHDHLTLWNLRHELAQANASVRIPFDPERQALTEVGNGAIGVSVGDFALPVSYSSSLEPYGQSLLATRLADRNTCDRVKNDPRYRAAGIYISGFHEPSAKIGRGTFVSDFCLISAPEIPQLPLLTISTQEKRTRIRGLPVILKTTVVTTPDGHHYAVKGGRAIPRPWVPLPVMGCALNSGAPSWDCFVGFSRAGSAPLIKGDCYECDSYLLGKALGLKAFAPGQRFVADPDELATRIAQDEQEMVRRETADLDRVIADPSVDVGAMPFNSLKGRQDILLPRLPRMVDAIERGYHSKRHGADNAQQLAHLVRSLPLEVFEPYVGRL